MNLPTQLLHVRLPKELLPKMDSAALQLYVTRSEFIRQAIVEKISTTLEKAYPDPQSINILMTDQQLYEVRELLRVEHMRRVGSPRRS